MLSRLDSLSIPEYEHQYSYDKSRQMRYIYYVKRDALLTDLVKKLTNGACESKLWKREV
jgi:hypothetical protein